MPDAEVEVSTYDVPDFQWQGVTEGEVRRYFSREFLDADGVVHLAGSVGDAQGAYEASPFTVTGSVATVEAYTTTATANAQDNAPSTILQTAALFSSDGQYLQTLYSNWQIPATTPTTFATLWNLNRSKYLPVITPQVVTQQQMIDYVQSVLGGRNYASSLILGNTYLDVDPAISTHPEAVGANSYASISHLGISKPSVAPALASLPIFVGDNDPRLPTAGEAQALAGTAGSPSSSNRYVTDSDSRLTAASATNVGVTALTVAPAFPATPIAVGANDPHFINAVQTSDARLPTAGEAQALAGTSGTPSSSNKYVTDADPRISVPGVFDANAAPYNCVPNVTADQTANIQAGVNAAVAYAALHGTAVIRFTPGAYRVSAALTQNVIYNAQVTIPVVSSGAARATLTVESKSQSHSPFPFTGGNGSVIFESTLTGLSYSASYGKPFIMAGPDAIHGTSPSLASYLSLRFRGVGFRAPQNPSIGGFNGEMIDQVIFENCAWGTTDPNLGAASQVVPTHPTGIAALGPREFFEGTLWLGTNTIAGWYAGFPIDEYTNGVGDMFAGQNVVNFNVSGSFYTLPIVNFATSIRGQYDIAHVDPQTGVTDIPDGLIATGFLPIRMTMRIENGPSPWNKIKNVLDGRNSLRGTIEYTQINSVVGLPSSDGLLATGLNNTGAYGVNFVNLLGPSLKRPVVHAQFVAPSSTALVSVPFTVNPSGATWSVPSGGLNADGNGALVGTSASPTYNRAFVNAGVADGLVSARIYFPSVNGSAGIVFRASDSSNFWHFELDAAGNYGLTKVVAGVPASGGCSGVAGGAINPFSTGREIPLGVLMTGTTFRILMNDNALCTITDSFNSTATGHGVETTGTVARVTEFMVSQ